MTKTEAAITICDPEVYRYALDFYKASRKLYPSEEDQSTVNAYFVNACLSLELFLKSLVATRKWKAYPNPTKYDEEADEKIPIIKSYPPPYKISKNRSHKLSELFQNLQADQKKSIQDIYEKSGCISTDIKKYDRSFVEWRYGYENYTLLKSNDPLESILYAVKSFCDETVTTQQKSLARSGLIN